MSDIQLAVAAPIGAPPYLSSGRLAEFCHQGHLSVDAPDHLARQCDLLFAAADRFFALQEVEKTALFPALSGDTEQGYVHLPEEKEYLTLRYANVESRGPNSAHPHSLEIERAVAETWKDAAAFLRRILGDLGRALQLADDAWDSLVERSLQLPTSREEATLSLLRVFRYEPMRGLSEPHRDVGLLTLCVCRGQGLEVWERRANNPDPIRQVSEESAKCSSSTRYYPLEEDKLPGRAHPEAGWREAGRFTVMAGETLRILSTNRVPAALHRVVTTELGRNSIVFALRPSTRHPIELSKFGGFGVVDSAALWQAIKDKRRFNVNQGKQVREQQKQAHARRQDSSQ